MHIYTIMGDPCPLARARISGRHVYDSQSEQKLYLKLLLTKQHGERELLKGPLFLHAVFYMAKPKSLKNANGKPHWYRPDLDNLLKMLNDLCNDVIIYDDSCLSKIDCQKLYDDIPRTEFYFEPLEQHADIKEKCRKDKKKNT